MKKFFSIAFVAISCVFVSCQKEVENDNPTSTGSSQDDYFPSTKGSQWKLNSSTSGEYYVTALGEDTLIGNDRYYKYNLSAGGRQYLSKTNGVYTSYAYVPQAGQSVKMISLKDAPAGTTWNNVLTTPSGNINYKYQVTGRDLEKTVNGTTFKNVIAVQYDLLIDDPMNGQQVKYGSGRHYYAKGVGAIASSFDVNFMGITSRDTTYLASYTIK
jgi:hypothetical protein